MAKKQSFFITIGVITLFLLYAVVQISYGITAVGTHGRKITISASKKIQTKREPVTPKRPIH